jgi:hypothetical protein
MIDVIVWVIRVVDAGAAVVPDPDRAVPVEPPLVRPVPPRVATGAVVSGGGEVVVVGSHGTVVEVDDGSVAATVVDVVEVVEVVEVDVVDVVVVVVDDSGVESGIDESTGVVVVVVVVGAGVLGVVQSSNAALAVAGTEEATVPVDRADVLGVLAATVLELAWPSMRCRMVSVDDSCTAPSTLSLVVRSPSFTVAVLKIDGAVADALVVGLRLANAAAAAPASATQMSVAITTRRLR